jgi:hypothetical protein
LRFGKRPHRRRKDQLAEAVVGDVSELDPFCRRSSRNIHAGANPFEQRDGDGIIETKMNIFTLTFKSVGISNTLSSQTISQNYSALISLRCKLLSMIFRKEV